MEKKSYFVDKKNLCCYKNCKNGRYLNNRRLFHFPTGNPTRCENWLKNCGNDELRKLSLNTLTRYGICSDHFPDNAFTDAYKMNLKRDSIPLPNYPPTLFVTEDNLNSDHSEMSSTLYVKEINVEESNVEENSLVPVKRVCTENVGEYTKPSTSNSCSMNVESYSASEYDKDQRIYELTVKIEEITKQNNNLKKQLKTAERTINYYKERFKESKSEQYIPKTRSDASQETIFKKQKNTVMSIINLMDLSASAKALISLQLHEDKTPYSDDERNLASQLYYYSPAALNRLRKAECKFPSPSTLKRWVMDFNIEPGFSSLIFKALKTQLEKLSPEERICCLKFDETTIKCWEEYSSFFDYIEGLEDLGSLGRSAVQAKYILVFCIDSINIKNSWRQPIAYFLSQKGIDASNLKNLLFRCLDELDKVGADVQLITCDQGPANQSLFNQLKVSVNKPHFEVNGKKYFASFDFPHLIKRLVAALRNKQKGKLFIGHHVIVDWNDYINTWQLDKANVSGSKLLSHITERHMNPKPWEAMNVKRAFQIFSRRFACAIATAGETGNLKSKTWRDSAMFAETLNSVIDACNSYSPNYTYGEKRVLSVENDDIKNTLENFVNWSKNWSTSSDQMTKLPCMKGLVITVQALLELYKSVQGIYPNFELATGLCNQDSVEHLFSKLRQRGGFNANPTARMCRISIRHIISNGYIHTSERGNVICSNASNLINAPSALSQEIIHQFDSSEVHAQEDDIDESERAEMEYHIAEVQKLFNDEQENSSHNTDKLMHYEKNAITYLSGFVAFKTLQKVDCQLCYNLICKSVYDKMTLNEIYLFNREYETPEDDIINEYNNDNGKGEIYTKLTRPSDIFVNIVYIQTQKFENSYKEVWASKNILKKLKDLCISAVNESVPDWFDTTDRCYQHRLYALEYLLTVKLHSQTRLHNHATRSRNLQNVNTKLTQKMRNLKGL